jgi:hypothetical protein
VPQPPTAVGTVVPATADAPADRVPVATPAATAGDVAGTGDPRVDDALGRLDRLDDLPVSEHVAEYDAVHRALQDALTAIDES